MKTSQTADFRSRLVEERERIIAEWRNHGGDHGPGEGWDLRDLEDRADLSTLETVERRITEDARNLLRKVDFALKRLDEGTYDRCDRCGAEIPIERLLAKPSVSLCLACQELKDNAKG
jgi:DnaK suppressor protein